MPRERSRSGIVPILRWLPDYDRSLLSKDAVAAASVWALLVPQGVAYASIAGVPAQYGLYAAMFSLTLYAVFGSSRHLVTGPSATVAAVSAAAVGGIAAAGAQQSDTWIALTATLAFVAGIIYIALGLLRMGWISSFLSSAVLEGFVFGFGIGLTIDQLHKILGTPKVEGSYLRVLLSTIADLPQTNLPTLAVGGAAIAFLLTMKRLAPRWPRALIVVAAGILASRLLDLSARGVAIVGEVPTGLPELVVPSLERGTILTLITGGLAIIMVGFSESLAAARAAASRHGYDIDASQEMIGQGAANAASGLFGGIPVAGSLSKSTVADLAGQRSQVASLLNAVLILLTVLFLAHLFTDLPEAVLGAVVIDAAVGLVRVSSLRRVARASRSDFAAYLGAMIGLLTIGVLAGVLIGVILSLLLLVSKASSSPVRRLGYLDAAQTFVVVGEAPGTRQIPGVLVVDVAGPLFFADAQSFRDSVLSELPVSGVHALVVSMAAVTHLDLDGAEMLGRLHHEVAERGIRMVLARVDEHVEEVLRTTGVYDEFGDASMYVSIRAAVAAITG